MKIFHNLNEYRKQPDAELPTCVTLGKFDGFHLGHQKLISRVLDVSRQRGLPSVVFMIRLKDRGILSHKERSRMLKKLGVDILVECTFSRGFMLMSAEEFIQDILADTLHASFVSVGTDFRFGHNRSGDAKVLQEFGEKYNYETDIIEKEMYLGEEISSTRVRASLAARDMELVAELLGREYGIFGTVQHGRGIGAAFGMPTVNLLPPGDKILPPDGVYASSVKLPDGSQRPGVTNIGFRPTVNGTHRTIETTLIDYSGNLYGAELTISLMHFIRGERKFASMEELKAQIEKDKITALKFNT